MLPGLRGKKAVQYIFFEMLPGFVLGLAVFVSIILMFQVLRLTEFALVHGVDLLTISQVIGYVCISMLPALFPMSLLFAVLLTYGRLSSDSEMVAMKACGLSMATLLTPALALGVLVSILSARTSFEIAPWGNRQFEVLYTKLGNTKAAMAIKPGVFSEGFFDMVVYANHVDSEKGHLEGVFIYDEKQGDTPLTIVAKSGQIIPDPERPGHRILLRLNDGDIHRKGQAHTKIKFDVYDLKLVDPIKDVVREKSPPSLTLEDIDHLLEQPDLKEDDRRTYLTEYHKRWAIAVLCPVFALLGVGLGTNTNRRQQKAGGMILCIVLIVIYWIVYVLFESMGRGGQLPPAVAIWLPNFIFGLLGLESLRRNWN
ncbi:MAG: LPS export ABC transporter permease LptF [Bdellovibrionaceae bacterium]|nr:LPS export ABC transporter permease LptF [Pseudobdellovibrionaceae bacterium]MBX3033203.1 LPS export ABC transporter permease LptF [Pseudobdellovibrionaceae bacterium]